MTTALPLTFTLQNNKATQGDVTTVYHAKSITVDHSLKNWLYQLHPVFLWHHLMAFFLNF